MKIRHGFVSNSSSTSFSIYGIYMESSEFVEKVLNAHPEFDKELEENGDSSAYALADLAAEKLNVEFDTYFPYDGDYIYIGLDTDSVRDDETGAQFKQRAKETLKKVMGEEVTPTYLSESWRDG